MRSEHFAKVYRIKKRQMLCNLAHGHIGGFDQIHGVPQLHRLRDHHFAGVLMNDPTRGYGIFIENMLEAIG